MTTFREWLLRESKLLTGKLMVHLNKIAEGSGTGETVINVIDVIKVKVLPKKVIDVQISETEKIKINLLRPKTIDILVNEKGKVTTNIKDGNNIKTNIGCKN